MLLAKSQNAWTIVPVFLMLMVGQSGAFVPSPAVDPFMSSANVRSFESASLSPMVPQKLDVHLSTSRRRTPSFFTFDTKLHATAVDQDEKSLLPSAVFLASAAALAKLFFDIEAANFEMTPGIWALLLTTVAVGYDNFIIGLGAPLFSDVETNTQKYNVLKALSFPRFTAHAVFVPFLYATAAEIGKAAGIEWLEGDTIQTLILAAAAVLGVVSRVNFVNSTGIDLADTSDSPPDAWERSLIWFTYKDVSFIYIIPAIVLALWNLVVGAVAWKTGQDPTASAFLVASAVAVLYGNSKPSYVMRFTGNLAEVVMLWCIYESALLTLK